MITLIHKGKDLEMSLKSGDLYRSQTLIPSSMLRLSRVIHNVINTDRVGYIRGQGVSSLLRLIDDVIDQLNVSQNPGLLITVEYFNAKA